MAGRRELEARNLEDRALGETLAEVSQQYPSTWCKQPNFVDDSVLICAQPRPSSPIRSILLSAQKYLLKSLLQPSSIFLDTVKMAGMVAFALPRPAHAP